MIESPKPGLYVGVPYETYSAWDAARASVLEQFRKTPAHARHALLSGGDDATRSTDLGSLFHLAVLEPDRFDKEVAVGPKVDKRTTVGKQAWAEFVNAHPGATLVDADSHRAALRMRESLMSNATAHEFFSGAVVSEVSFAWIDEETGVPCKGRVDALGQINGPEVIGELKSARSAGHRAFSTAIETYGYHIAAAHYLAGIQALYPTDGLESRFHFFFVVENEEPHCTAVYQSEELMLGEGDRIRMGALRKWAECMKTGIWPGYPDGADVIGLPRWAMTNFTLED